MRSATIGVALLMAAALVVLVFSDGTVEILGYEALVLVAVLTALWRGTFSNRSEIPDFRFSRRHPARLPPRLVDFERLVAFSQTAMFDFDHRLLPKLREIADGRLLETHGFTSSDDPESAAGVFGADAWGFLRPDRKLVDDVGVPGPSYAELDSLVAALESLRSDQIDPGLGSRT